MTPNGNPAECLTLQHEWRLDPRREAEDIATDDGLRAVRVTYAVCRKCGATAQRYFKIPEDSDGQ